MIREYVTGDELQMVMNAYSNLSVASDIIANDNVSRITIEDMTGPKVIAFWYEYAPTKFATFLLMDVAAKMKNIKELKEVFIEVIKLEEPKELLTFSYDIDVINRWHEFLGFTKDTTGGYDLDGKHFNKWIMRWE